MDKNTKPTYKEATSFLDKVFINGVENSCGKMLDKVMYWYPQLYLQTMSKLERL